MPDLRQGCATGKNKEETMPADALVLFGAMGDLAHKKIFPALYHMVRHGHLDVDPDMPVFEICDCDGYGSLFDEWHEFDEHGFPFLYCVSPVND